MLGFQLIRCPIGRRISALPPRFRLTVNLSRQVGNRLFVVARKEVFKRGIVCISIFFRPVGRIILSRCALNYADKDSCSGEPCIAYVIRGNRFANKNLRLAVDSVKNIVWNAHFVPGSILIDVLDVIGCVMPQVAVMSRFFALPYGQNVCTGAVRNIRAGMVLQWFRCAIICPLERRICCLEPRFGFLVNRIRDFDKRFCIIRVDEIVKFRIVCILNRLDPVRRIIGTRLS